MPKFSDTLIGWYQENARSLPWRGTGDPYRIWLSEIILQQTRVEQGRGYYERFLREYPTVQALAAAPEEQVLKTWQGLGYYSRARNLHKAAQAIAALGHFPSTYEALLALPGVGPYTAAAIASFAFREPRPVVDGNVYRFLSRLHALPSPVPSPAAQREIETLLLSEIDRERPDLFNQGLMEMGALVCTPQSPRCAECPFAGECQDHRRGTELMFPVKAPKRQPRDVWLYYYHLSARGLTLLHPRQGRGIWRGLYELPLLESPRPLSEAEQRAHLAALGLPPDLPLKEPPVELLHKLTHRTLHATFLRPILPDIPLPVPAGEQAYTEEERKKLPVSRLIDRYLSAHP